MNFERLKYWRRSEIRTTKGSSSLPSSLDLLSSLRSDRAVVPGSIPAASSKLIKRLAVPARFVTSVCVMQIIRISKVKRYGAGADIMPKGGRAGAFLTNYFLA